MEHLLYNIRGKLVNIIFNYKQQRKNNLGKNGKSMCYTYLVTEKIYI